MAGLQLGKEEKEEEQGLENHAFFTLVEIS
jgi:hypothetical protein